MTVALPAEYDWGFVTGKIIHARGDQAPDADRLPEASAATGSVRFTPLTRTRRASDALVIHEVVSCDIGPDGIITDAENLPGVWLFEGAYRVEFTLGDGGSYPPFDIAVTAAHTIAAPLDLATVAPYTPPTGTTATVMLIPSGAFDGAVLGWSGTALAWQAGGGGPATRGLIVTAVDVPTIPAGDTTDNLAAYYNSAAVPITVQGVELAAGRHAVWVWVGGAWVLLSSGTSTPPDPSDTTPPVWTATLTTGAPTDTAVVIAASALATDDVAVTGYRWRLTGEDAGVARTITPSGTNFTLDGLTASTSYAAPIFWAVDAGGNKSAELTAQTFTTDSAPLGWVTVHRDTFTDTDGALLAAHTPDTGAAWNTPQAPGLTIYGNRLRPSRTADFTGSSRGHYVEVGAALATKKIRLTSNFKSGDIYQVIGFTIVLNNFAGNAFGVNWYVGSAPNSSAYNVTATETSGLATTAPGEGTAVLEIDNTTGTLHINGVLFRSWTFDWQGKNFTSYAFNAGGNDIYDGLAVGAMSVSWLDDTRIEHWQ